MLADKGQGGFFLFLFIFFIASAVAHLEAHLILLLYFIYASASGAEFAVCKGFWTLASDLGFAAACMYWTALQMLWVGLCRVARILAGIISGD